MPLLQHIEFQSLKTGNTLMPDEYEHADQILKKTLLLKKIRVSLHLSDWKVADTKCRLLVFQMWRLE